MTDFVFKANLQQVKEIALLAINASKPIGMGKFFASEENHNISELEPLNADEIGFDYFEGRCVKLEFSASETDDNIWTITRGYRPHLEYQTWAWKYPTCKDLIGAVGLKPYER